MRSSSGSELISVVMPVHNALPHLDAAVQSILDQSHRDFEFVIYDDASTDGSTERLREWAKKDARIRLFEGKSNLGLVGSSRFVVDHSTHPLIARMDADDLSAPDRLASELAVLRDSPDVGLVGTLFDIIDETDDVIRGPDYWRLARKSPFVPFAAHGSIMFRRSIFEEVGGYRDRCQYWEDQDLVVRIAAASGAMVIPRPLYRVRQWNRPGKAPADPAQVEDAVDLLYRSMARLAEGRGYDDLLQAESSPTRVDPRVFIAGGSRVLWAGGRPKMFGRLLKRGRLGFNRSSAFALVWTAWAASSPGTLRLFLRTILKARNIRARPRSAQSEPLRWAPPAKH